MTDRATGLRLPIAQAVDGTKSIVGLPRLIETGSRAMGGILAPILAGANLLATGANVWMTSKLRREVATGLHEVSEGLADTRSELAAGLREVSTGLADAKAEAAAGFLGIRKDLADIKPQVAQLELTMAYGVALLGRVEEQQRIGFGGVLDGLTALHLQQLELAEALEEAIRAEGNRIALRELRTLAEKLAAAQKKLRLADSCNSPAREIDFARRLLEGEVVPALRAHVADKHSYGENIPIVLLASSAYRAWATAGLAEQDSVVARQAFAEGRELVHGALNELLEPSVAAFDFFVTGIPAARVLVAVQDGLRIGELAISGAPLIKRVNLAEPGPGADRLFLATVDVAWPQDLSKGRNQPWNKTYYDWRLARRTAGCEVKEGSVVDIGFAELAKVARVPTACLPARLTSRDADRISPLLEILADPAEGMVERALLRDAAGLEEIGSEAWERAREDAARYVARATSTAMTAIEVSAMSPRTVLLLAHRYRLEESLPSSPRCKIENVR